MRVKRRMQITAVGLALCMTVSLVSGQVSGAAEPAGTSEVSYRYQDTYTYGYVVNEKNEGKLVAYKDGVKQDDVTVQRYTRNTDDPFTPAEEQPWNKEQLELTPGLTYTTEDGKVHEITSMLTNWNFAADPTAIDNSDVDGRLYVYGTTDDPVYRNNGTMNDNHYKNHSLTIMSTKDMVNWTDEGFMDNLNLTNEPESSTNKKVCDWIKPSGSDQPHAWAPSGLKYDGDGDGKEEFYLFYTDGGSVGYVQGDSPTGPWKDDLGTALFTTSSPNCADVVWCFDPAVLVDDKGDAYVYFGGGVPTGEGAHPKTGRVCKIKFEKDTGKVEPDGEPQVMDAYYFLEDNEINQFHGKYFYSYCTHSVPVDNPFTGSGQIACFVSDDPMNITFDPDKQESTEKLKFLGTILDNPSVIYGNKYNNHHHMLTFKGHEYIAYHSTALENMMYHTLNQYRCLHVDEIKVDENTDKISITPTYEGPEQIESFNPYEKINATTTSYSAGVKSAKSDGVMAMVLDKINTGDWTRISGVDFGDKGAAKVAAAFASTTDQGAIEVFVDDPTVGTNKIASIGLKQTGADQYETVEAEITAAVTGKHDVYFVFRGTGYQVANWEFTEKSDSVQQPTKTPGATQAPGTSTQTPSVPTATPSVTPTASPAATAAPTVDDTKTAVAKPVIKSVKNVKGKKAMVTLKKKVSGASGYEIRYSLKKNMKSAKKVTLKKASLLKATLKGLKKKTYYVQARAYRTDGTGRQYSGWSGKKSVKIKK